MAKRFLFRMLPLLVVLIWPCMASAGFFVQSPDGQTVNLRLRPSMASSVLARVPDGSEITLVQTESEWSHVRWEETDGYMLNRYIIFVSEDTGESASVGGVVRYVRSPNSAPVNVRQTPDPHGPLVDRLPTGTEVVVTDPGEEWTEIEGPDGPEYILTEYLTEDPPELWDDPGQMYILSENSFPVNIRTAPKGHLLMRVPTGTRVEVIDQEGDWSQITVSGKTGYVLTRYLTDVRPEMLDRSYTAYVSVKDGFVRVRYGAGKGYDTAAKLTDGTEVTVIGSVKGWARIRCGDIEGYIDEQYLRSEP
ncbi:MAG: SH3 domain-containing protein [Clostridia bacterium]|nr:SH3 domain-containing protein [Clostridia bacterium]